MTDRPIPFSDPMVSALLAGRKSQTRRIAMFVEELGSGLFHVRNAGGGIFNVTEDHVRDEGADYAPLSVGDRLWVRETYWQRGHWVETTGLTKQGRVKWSFVPVDDDVRFDRPDGEVRLGRHHRDPQTITWHKRLGRFMARKYSRITLDVTDVRVERLRDITEDDAAAEGVYPSSVYGGRVESWLPAEDIRDRFHLTAFGAFNALWDHIHGDGAWTANPWVMAVNFSTHLCNIDRMEP